MRSILIYALLILLCIGCNKSNTLSFENVNFINNRCDHCPLVDINIPKATDKNKISRAINYSLEEEIIAELTFDSQEEVMDIKSAINSFAEGYANIQKMYPEEMTPWEAKINAGISYEDHQMITIRIETYLFTGGAHGYASTRFINFNKNKGEEIEARELFNNTEAFERFAENKFRQQEKIAKDQSINSTGYMFESDAFYLPENIGFTERGIKLLYNQYEVASYADGPIELILPYKEVKKYLAGELKS